jgi:hypothetical protein
MRGRSVSRGCGWHFAGLAIWRTSAFEEIDKSGPVTGLGPIRADRNALGTNAPADPDAGRPLLRREAWRRGTRVYLILEFYRGLTLPCY